MKKIFVFAIVVLLSLALIGAADTVKNTQKAPAKAKIVTKLAPESQAKPVQQSKAKPPKPVDIKPATEEGGLNIDPKAINEPEATPAKGGLSKPVINGQVSRNKAGYLGLGYDKNSPEYKVEGENSATILELLQQASIEQKSSENPAIQSEYIEQPKWEPQYGSNGELLNPQPALNSNEQSNGTEPGGSGIITSTTLLFQNFNQAGWSLTSPPTGWTVIDSGSEGRQGLWWADDWHKFYYTAAGWADTVFATLYSAASTESTTSEWLITPAFDLSAATACSVYFKQFYDNQNIATDSANVMVSVDNGTTWARANTQKADSPNPSYTWIDLAAYIGPSNTQVKVGFWHNLAPTPAPSGNGWIVDSITVRINGVDQWVQDFSNVTSGWFGNTPPSGPGDAWTILDNSISSRPAMANSNDWNRRAGNLGGDTVAAVTYTGTNNRREWENEWMISPSFSIGSGVACSLSLAQYWNIDAVANMFPPTSILPEHGYIRIQETTDGGLTWGPWSVVQDHNTVVVGGSNIRTFFTYDLSSWVTKTVRLSFNKVAPPEANFATWYIDDVRVTQYYTDDIGVTQIVAPPAGILWTGVSIPVQAKYKNVGTTAQTFDATMVISDSLINVYSNTVTSLSLNPGDSVTVSFPNFTPVINRTHTFTASVANPGDLDATNDVLAATRLAQFHYPTGGPDAGTYKWIDNTAIGGPAFGWIDMTAGTVVTFSGGTSDDGWSYGIPLGASFYYYGSFKTRLYVGTNGFISFDSLTTSYASNSTLPNSSVPNNLIAVVWDDLVQRASGVKYLSDLVNNRFVVQYDSCYFYSTTTSYISAQAILNFADSSIVLQYLKPSANAQTDVSIGIENGTGTIGLSYFQDGLNPVGLGNYPKTGTAIKFFPHFNSDDIAASAITRPGNFISVGMPYAVNGKCRNVGLLAQTFDARMVINDGTSDVYDNTILGLNLNPGDSITVTAFPDFTPATATMHTFTLSVINPGDEGPTNNSVSRSITAYIHEGTGGPDGGLYSWIDNTVIGGPAFNWADMSTALPCTLSSYDDGFKRVAMGAPFYFYGTNFDSLTIGSNGYVTFDFLSSSPGYNAAIPDVAVPNNLIDFMRRDMNNRVGSVTYLNDVIGNRFVVQYDSIVMYNTAFYQDVQVILNRADSTVVLQYQDVSGNGYTNFTIGTENATGSTGLSYYYSATALAGLGNYPYGGLAVKFFYTAPSVDVGIASIDSPPPGFVSIGTAYDFKATATNFTTNAATFNVEFYADAVLLGTVTGVNLPSLGSLQVTCPVQWTPATTGDHTLMATTVLPGDANSSNDARTALHSALGPVVTEPFSTDFEADNGGFVGLTQWQWGVPNYAGGPATSHSLTQCWGTNLTGDYNPATLNTLYSAPLNLAGGVAPTVKFWIWYALESGYDGGNVKISNDNGATWSVITTSIAYNGTGYAGAPGIAGQPVWSGNLSVWTEAIISLAAYAGQTVILRFDQSSDGSVNYAGLYMDDFSVAEPPTDDIGVSAILAPGTITIQGFSWTVASRVHNFGAGTQTNVPVHFEIYDSTSALVYDQTYNLSSIGPGQDSTIIFTAWAPAEANNHSLVSYTILTTDINHANDTTRAASFTYPHRGNGSIPAGYSYADNVNGGGPAFSWIDITSVGTLLTYTNTDDGNSGMQDMGFNFNYFGTLYSRLNVNVNGWVSFTDSTSTAYNNVTIPTSSLPNAMVALLWDDLHLRTSGKIYKYFDAINNEFIIQYDSVEYYSPSGNKFGAEVIFNGNDNSIKMQYNYFIGGSQTDVTIGLENQTGLIGLAYDNNGVGNEIGQTPLPGVAVTYSYNPPLNDVAFERIFGQVGREGSLPVSAIIANNGANAANATVNFTVTQGLVTVFTGTGTGVIPADGSAQVTASTNWTAVPGSYEIAATVTAEFDTDPTNNSGNDEFKVVGTALELPVVENYESGTFPPANWSILHYGDVPPEDGWMASTAAYRSPITSAFIADTPPGLKDEWMVMRPINLTSGFLPSWKFYEDGLYWADYGMAHEFYVAAGPVFDAPTAGMIAQYTPLNHTASDFASGPGGIFDLASFNGNSVVWCAFRYLGDYSDQWYIDDVSISDAEMYDAAVNAVNVSATIVQPGQSVGITVELINYGYLPLTATLTTTGSGAVSGQIYSDIQSGIAMDGFDTVLVTLPNMTTVAGCGEVYTITSTVSAAGDNTPSNNIGLGTVSSTFIFEAYQIDQYEYYYWPQVWYYARQIGKPAEGVISHASISFNDGHIPRTTFDFLIFPSVGGVPGTDTLYAVNVQNTAPSKTLVDISSVYASLPDTFFFAIHNINGFSGAPYYTGPISDAGELGGVGSFRAVDNTLTWLAFPYTCNFSAIVDVRGSNFIDLTADAITAPGSVVIGAGPFPVTGTVSNVGTVDVSGGSAHMVITKPGGIVDFDATAYGINLTIGSNTSVNFGPWAPSTGGIEYTVTLTVSVPSENDVCNNTATKTVLAITGSQAVFNNFEGGNGGFTGTPVWQYGTPNFGGGPAAYSGSNCWGTILNGNYPSSSCDSLRTPQIMVPAAGGAMVVYIWYDNEYTWDGCNIKMSVNGGPYDLVTPIGGYDFVEGGYVCGLVASQGFYTGTSGGWIAKAVELSAYAGQMVSFSFDFASDSNTEFAGTYLDDFSIYDYSGIPYVSDIAVTPASVDHIQDVNTTQTYNNDFTIANNGNVPLTYSVVNQLSWVTFAGFTGTIAPAGTNPINVTINTNGITPGVYADTLTITSNDPDSPVLHTPIINITVNQSGCVYVVGDVNGDTHPNGLDVTYGVRYFKGELPVPELCECGTHGLISVAATVNGDCVFNGLDITFMVRFYKGEVPALLPCPDCPPVGNAPALMVPGTKANTNTIGASE